MNRRLSATYRDWMEPPVWCGLFRPMSMLLLTAVVTGPTHAIARRWLAGQLPCPPHDYLDELAGAASAALSGTLARGRRPPRPVARYGRVRPEFVADDGSAIGQGVATAAILPLEAAGDRSL
jgi:hypothetical protein